jgi:hypothetical protein
MNIISVIYMYPISNAHTPYNNINDKIVNLDNSHTTNIPFSEIGGGTYGPHTMAPPGNNVQSAAAIYPCAQKGGKINRAKINKISRKYKMKGSKRTRRMRARRMKSRVRSKMSKRQRRRTMRGGAGIATAPNYPAGYTQFDNTKVLSNIFSTGGFLPPQLSALASPTLFHKLMPDVDNLIHTAPNAHGNYGAGSGFPSRGWF